MASSPLCFSYNSWIHNGNYHAAFQRSPIFVPWTAADQKGINTTKITCKTQRVHSIFRSVYNGELKSNHGLSFASASVIIHDLYQFASQELGEENFIQDHKHQHLENETMLKLPCAGDTLCDGKESSFRIVTSSCAICLSCYQYGERIVWSSNVACAHIYHHYCMITWMNKRKSIDCPCCRQNFVVE